MEEQKSGNVSCFSTFHSVANDVRAHATYAMLCITNNFILILSATANLEETQCIDAMTILKLKHIRYLQTSQPQHTHAIS
jgi:hypothetical protein